MRAIAAERFTRSEVHFSFFGLLDLCDVNHLPDDRLDARLPVTAQSFDRHKRCCLGCALRALGLVVDVRDANVRHLGATVRSLDAVANHLRVGLEGVGRL